MDLHSIEYTPFYSVQVYKKADVIYEQPLSRRYPRKSRGLFRLLMKLRKSSFIALISTVLLTDGEGVVPPVALA